MRCEGRGPAARTNMADFSAPKGMRDFYPEDYRAREALFSAWRGAAARHGFELYDAPVVETLDLLERKAGEEISEQIYLLEQKGSQRLALRAELTPSLARLIIARQGGLAFPLKWSAIAQCFRYERMQRGRKREHYQWNLDIVGEESVVAEAEVIGTAISALRALGLTHEDFQVRVGSRSVLAELFRASGVGEEHFMACCLALDKRGKITDEEVAQLLQKEGVGAEDSRRIFELLALTTLDQVAERLGEGSVVQLAPLRELFALAEGLGFAEYLTFDLAVIRGLGYYTGIVFEAFDTAGRLRAIFGGGRYDSLLSSLGGQAMPCVGLGFGDVVVMELLAERGLAPKTERTIEYAVGYMDEACRPVALRVAAALRGAGWPTDLALAPEKPRKFFNRTDKSGAERAIYIGPDEANSETFTIKHLRGGESVQSTLQGLGNP